MKLTERVKSISFFKTHAAEIVRGLARGEGPLVITKNGEAKAVLQDIASYEETQETLTLLKMLALSTKDIEEGRVRPVNEAFADIRRHVKT